MPAHHHITSQLRAEKAPLARAWCASPGDTCDNEPLLLFAQSSSGELGEAALGSSACCSAQPQHLPAFPACLHSPDPGWVQGASAQHPPVLSIPQC